MKKAVFTYIRRKYHLPVSPYPVNMEMATDIPLGLACVKGYAAAEPAIAGKAELSSLSFGEEMPAEKIAARLAAQKPDVAAFSLFILNSAVTLEVCRLLKAKLPGVKIAVGGPDVPCEPAELEKFLRASPALDAAVFGEGERPFAGWLRGLLAGARPVAAPGLAVRDGKKILIGRGTAAADTGSLPSPYLTGAIELAGATGVLALETARGCRFACAYCSGARSRGGVRNFPVERLRAELAWLRRRGFKGIIWLTDPIANLEAARTAAVLRLLAGAGGVSLDIDLDLLDDKQVALMKKVPHLAAAIGVQSVNAAALRNMGRAVDIAAGAEKIRALQGAGVTVILQFILGLPWDNYQTFKASLDWALGFGPLRCDVYDLAVLTNSRLAAMTKKFSIRANKAGIVTANVTFSAAGLKRASWLAAVYNSLCRDHNALALFQAAVLRKGRASEILERLALRARKAGHIPDSRLFINGERAYEAIPLSFLKKELGRAGT